MDYNFSKKVDSLKPSAIREIFKYSADPSYVPLSAGNPSPEGFPIEQIKAISSKIFDNSAIDALQYSITEGYRPLIDLLRNYLVTKYDVGAEFDEIMITSGAQQAIDLATKALCNEGDTVICESPSFIGSLNCFRSYGCNIIGAPMDSDGINLTYLDNLLKTEKNVKLIYTIPNFQNPTGITMSAEKRKALYCLARNHNVLILEDNPYGRLYYKEPVAYQIKSMDSEEAVIYVGSFSKIISPGLRVGWAVAPKKIIQKMVVCKQAQDVHTNIWAQMLVYEFIKDYDIFEHLNKLRTIYGKKAEYTKSLLDKYTKGKIKYTDIDGGLFTWCTLPDGIDMPDFCNKLLERKVCVVPGNAFSTNQDEPCQSFRINFSTPTGEQLERGIKTIGELINEMI